MSSTQKVTPGGEGEPETPTSGRSAQRLRETVKQVRSTPPTSDSNLSEYDDMPKTPDSDRDGIIPSSAAAAQSPGVNNNNNNNSSLPTAAVGGGSGSSGGNVFEANNSGTPIKSKTEQNAREILAFVGKVSAASLADPRAPLEAVLDGFGFHKATADSSDDDLADTRSSSSFGSFSFGSEMGGSSAGGFFPIKNLQGVLTHFSSDLAHRSYIENNPEMLSREQQEARSSGWKPKKAELLELQKTVVPFRGFCAVAFLDLSGYSTIASALTEQGGAHALAASVNSYFETLLAIVVTHEGSVTSFAGDAVCIVWPTSSARSPEIACLKACVCAMEIQRRAPSSQVEGTNLTFKNHIAIAYGELESVILKCTKHENNNEAYHYVEGQPLVEISTLLDMAKATQVVVSSDVHKIVKKFVRADKLEIIDKENLNNSGVLPGSADFGSSSPSNNNDATAAASGGTLDFHTAFAASNLASSPSSTSSAVSMGNILGGGSSPTRKTQYAYLLRSLDDEYHDALERAPADLHIQRSPWIEKALVPSSVTSRLKQGFKAAHIAEMRFLCVLFVRKQVSQVSTESWFAEVHAILDEARAPIVQCLYDDKGPHLIACVSLYNTVCDCATVGVRAARQLWERETGSVVGVACGDVYFGVTGSDQHACRVDISGNSAVRAARIMVHGIEQGHPVVIDESVAKHISDSSELASLGQIRLKGSPDPVRIFRLVPKSVSVTAGIVSTSWSSETLHQHHRKKLVEEFLGQKYQRGLCYTHGPVASGKKTLVNLTLQMMRLNNIYHFSTQSSKPLQLLETLSDWFNHHQDRQLAEFGRKTAEHLRNGRITQSLALMHQAISRFISLGLTLVVVVSGANVLDKSSMDFIKSVVSAIPTVGEGRFLFVLTSFFLWGKPLPHQLTEELTRPLRENRRFLDTLVEDITTIELKNLMQTELVTLHVNYAADPEEFADAFRGASYWVLQPHAAAVLHEATGGCLALIKPVADMIRARYLGLLHEANYGKLDPKKAFLPATLDGTMHMTQAGEDFFFTEIDWKKLSSSATARFLELYDALPSRLQLVLRVVASLSSTTGNAAIPHVTRIMLKLNSKLSESRLESDIELLKEAEILKTPKEDDGSEVTFCVPAFIDCISALQTPEQTKLMRRYALKIVDTFYSDPSAEGAKAIIDKEWMPIFASFCAKSARAAGERDLYRQYMLDSWHQLTQTSEMNTPEKEWSLVRRRLEERFTSEHRRHPDLLPKSLFSNFAVPPRFEKNVSEHELNFMKQESLPEVLAWIATPFMPTIALGAIGGEMQMLCWQLANSIVDFTKPDDIELVSPEMREMMVVNPDQIADTIEYFDKNAPPDDSEAYGEMGVKPLESQLIHAPKKGVCDIYDNYEAPKNAEEERKLLHHFAEYPASAEEGIKCLRLFRAYYYKFFLKRRERAILQQRQITSVDQIQCPHMLAYGTGSTPMDGLKKAYTRLCTEYPIAPSPTVAEALMDLSVSGYGSLYFNFNLMMVRDQLFKTHEVTIDDFKSYLACIAMFGQKISTKLMC